MACKEIALNLAQCVETDADDDEQARAAEELRNLRVDVHGVAEYHREHCENRKEDGSRESDPRHRVVKELRRGMSRLNARDVAALLLEVVRNLYGIELVGHPEEREDQNHDAIDYDIRDAAVLKEACNPADDASIREEAHDHHREREDRAQ